MDVAVQKVWQQTCFQQHLAYHIVHFTETMGIGQDLVLMSRLKETRLIFHYDLFRNNLWNNILQSYRWAVSTKTLKLLLQAASPSQITPVQ